MGHKPNLTEDDLNAWLARRLFLDMKRLEQFGVTGRCEAISDWKFNNKARNRGLQCGHSAKTMRDGRRVCNSHGELATRTTYVNESPCDGYDHLREIMTRLARIDPKLKQCMQLACEAA